MPSSNPKPRLVTQGERAAFSFDAGEGVFGEEQVAVEVGEIDECCDC